MVTISNWDRKALIRELRKGHDLAKQLMLHLSSASSHETKEMLIRGILSSYEKALLILSKAGSASWQPQPVGPAAVPKKRDYYRCRHKYDQNCRATKQTQRPDDDEEDDPTVLNITYRGSHICSQASQSLPPSASPEKQELKKNNNYQPQQQQQQQQQQQTNEMLFNFRANLRINTEELNYKTFLMFVAVLFVLCACLLVVLMCCVSLDAFRTLSKHHLMA